LKLLPGLSEKNSISRAKLKILSEVTSVLWKNSADIHYVFREIMRSEIAST
jgi:hypothetical protein